MFLLVQQILTYLDKNNTLEEIYYFIGELDDHLYLPTYERTRKTSENSSDCLLFNVNKWIKIKQIAIITAGNAGHLYKYIYFLGLLNTGFIGYQYMFFGFSSRVLLYNYGGRLD